MKPTHIVLLGGGYVSVWAYRSLISRLRSQVDSGQVRITVICPYEYHFFHGWTAESLTGIIKAQNRQSPLAEIMPKATLLLGKADELDTTAQVVYVTTHDGSRQAISYDHILLGIGSYDCEAVEGIRTHGYQIKSPEAFERTKRAIRQLVEQAAESDLATARQLLRFTVAGGGFTGVELATNLAEFVRLLKNRHQSLQEIEPQICLVNSGDRVLATLQSRFGRLVNYAEQTMHQYGIEVINNARLVEVTAQGAILDYGLLLESSLVISTVGQSRFVLKGTEHLPRNPMQRLYTNSYQQVNDLPNVWGGGDACHVRHYKTQNACPANALWAIKHGEYVGKNIARAIQGKALKPFTYPGLGQSASLGLGKGITELYGIPFTGPLAWIMRWFFFHYFMPSRRIMLHTVGDWLFLLFRRQRKGLQPQQSATEPAPAVVHQPV